MKIRNAFAFRDFDAEKILQRPFFRQFGFDANKSDEEIITSLSATDFESLEITQRKFDTMRTLLVRAVEYQKHVERHGDRLTKYARAVERKITVDETVDISALRKRHERAGQLLMKYCGCMTVEGVKSFFLAGISVDNIGRLCSKIGERYKELDEKIKMHYRKIFAQRLKAARKAAKLTQEKFAPRLGLTKNGYALYETAKRDPSIPTLIRLAKELHCTADNLLGLT